MLTVAEEPDYDGYYGNLFHLIFKGIGMKTTMVTHLTVAFIFENLNALQRDEEVRKVWWSDIAVEGQSLRASDTGE